MFFHILMCIFNWYITWFVKNYFPKIIASYFNYLKYLSLCCRMTVGLLVSDFIECTNETFENLWCSIRKSPSVINYITFHCPSYLTRIFKDSERQKRQKFGINSFIYAKLIQICIYWCAVWTINCWCHDITCFSFNNLIQLLKNLAESKNV